MAFVHVDDVLLQSTAVQIYTPTSTAAAAVYMYTLRQEVNQWKCGHRSTALLHTPLS